MSHRDQTVFDHADQPESMLPVLWQLQLSHYNEKVRWALDYKRVPHVRRSLLPGRHIRTTRRLTGDTSTTPVLTLDGRSIGDSTLIIAAIERRWPHPPLYPEDPVLRREALELEEYFDEELGPHIRRAMYHEMLPHPELLLPRFTNGQSPGQQLLLRAGFPALRAAMRRRMDIRPETAAASRAKVVVAMDRLEREIANGRYLAGDSFTVADLTAAALFYGVARPPEFPYPMVASDDLPESWREFLDSLARRPGGQWITETYRRHRGRSAERSAAQAARIAPITNTPAGLNREKSMMFIRADQRDVCRAADADPEGPTVRPNVERGGPRW